MTSTPADPHGQWDSNATVMAVAVHDRDPAQVFMAARKGEVFATRDGGASWEALPLPANVRDVYALACG